MPEKINTDVDDLYQLRTLLEKFEQSTQYLELITESILSDFEDRLRTETQWIEINQTERVEEFQLLKYKYQNIREQFSEQINRLLQHKIVSAEGHKNIYTLIAIIERYQNI